MKLRKYLVLALVFILCALCAGYVWLLSTHLGPGGAHKINGLSAEVTLDEDNLGVATITGKSLLDVVRVQGWLLARERFFQMDLIRRRSAGRLSEIFGAGALESDRIRRIYGLRAFAENLEKKLHPESKVILQAYADGVNDFLKAGVLPLEISVLGYQPDPWKISDTVLVALSMEGLPNLDRELRLARKVIPKDTLKFFMSSAGFLDAPIVEDAAPPGLPAIPKVVQKGNPLPEKIEFSDPENDGSNAWAISGAHTESGKPILAGDPHLHLDLPNVWFRLKLKTPEMEVTGVTLPGLPGVLIGSNKKLAWTFTNAAADSADFIPVTSATPFQIRKEEIVVKGGATVTEEVKVTAWGPVVSDGKESFAVHWTALDPEIYSRVEVTQLNLATNLEEAFTALKDWCAPVHNVIIATFDGHLGWTIAGRIKNRGGFDGSLTTTKPRPGYLPFSRYPKVVDPKSGFIVSANQRYVPLNQQPEVFSTDWPSPARAFRIKKELLKKSKWTAEDAYQLQLDVFSEVHDWYRRNLLTVIGIKTDPWSIAINDLISHWDGRITVESPGYVFMRRYREAFFETILAPYLAGLKGEDQVEVLSKLARDEWLVALLTAKPMSWLGVDPDAKISAVAISVAKELVSEPEKLKLLRWGDLNKTIIRNPLARALPPYLGKLINAPEEPLPGSGLVPREGYPSHAASMRMVVDLADPKKSIFNQPGGQSGFLLSTHYQDQFKFWLAGKAKPFEPEKSKVNTKFLPRGQSE